MDAMSPWLSTWSQESIELLSPNLRPRHEDLIPSPCGPRKRWSELSKPLRGYYIFTIASLLVLVVITLFSTVKQRMSKDVSEEDNFTVSLILLVGILFCIYYISRGVLQENKQELVAFLLCILIIMIRSVINFIVLGSNDKQQLELRFVYIMCLGVIHVVCISYLFCQSNMMAFRVAGGLDHLQERYCLFNLCFSLVTFDLQAQVCLCILITTTDPTMPAANSIILGIGVSWAVVVAVVGAVAVLKEVRTLMWTFLVFNLPQVAFFVYVMYKIIQQWPLDDVYVVEAAAVTVVSVSLLIKGILLWGLVRLLQSWPQGQDVEVTEPKDEERR